MAQLLYGLAKELASETTPQQIPAKNYFVRIQIFKMASLTSFVD